MKKFTILFLLVILYLFSCSVDDTIENNNQLKIEKNNIIGTWKSTETSDNSGNEFEPFTPIAEEDQYRLTFLSDDTFINTSTPQCNGVYSIEQEDRKLILNFEQACSISQSSSTISSLTNNELVLIRSGGDEGFKIKFEKE